jgi:hypothetical protein
MRVRVVAGSADTAVKERRQSERHHALAASRGSVSASHLADQHKRTHSFATSAVMLACTKITATMTSVPIDERLALGALGQSIVTTFL